MNFFVFCKLDESILVTCVINNKAGQKCTFTVENQNYTLIKTKDNTKNCLPSGKDHVTVFSNSMKCKHYEFIFSSDDSFTAFPRDGITPCPLIGFDIVNPTDIVNPYCDPYNVQDGKCPQDNSCFKTQSWEECGNDSTTDFLQIVNILFKLRNVLESPEHLPSLTEEHMMDGHSNQMAMLTTLETVAARIF